MAQIGGGSGGAGLSEGHEEFIGLLCLAPGELGTQTMAGLGPLSSSLPGSVRCWPHAGGEPP